MASYKNRCKELEAALRGIHELVDTYSRPVESKEYGITKICDVVLKGGRLEDAKVMLWKTNLLSGKDIQVAVGTPIYLDPSSETYHSM